MIRWHFSKPLRDFLADLPKENREDLVRTLGKFQNGVLPSADNSRWVVEFDTQSGLRGVLEKDVVVALKSDNLEVPQTLSTENEQSSLAAAIQGNHQDGHLAGFTHKGCVFRDVLGHSDALIAQKLRWLLSINDPSSEKNGF